MIGFRAGWRLPRTSALSVAVAATLCAARASPSQTPPAAAVRTLRPTEPSCRRCGWQVGRAQSIREIAGDSSLWFASVTGAALDGSGRLYVADGLARRLTQVDLRTRSVRTLGREGEGPGELRMPQLVAPGTHGRLFVYDAMLRRVSEFDTSGVFYRSFRLPVTLHTVWAMVADGAGHLFLSGPAMGEPYRRYVVHKIATDGSWIASFVERDSGSADEIERMYGDGGVLWWDSLAGSIWFSRGGPSLELLQLSTDGTVLRRILFATPLVPNWASPVEVSPRGSQLGYRPRDRFGTAALVPLPGGHLANVARVGEQDRLRYDVFRTRDGAYVASWIEARRDTPVLGDGRRLVITVAPRDEPDLWVHRITFTPPRR